MVVPKKHKEQLRLFIRNVLKLVVTEELTRAFHKFYHPEPDYLIAIHSTGLLPKYNDDRIEVTGNINGKKLNTFFILPANAFITKKVPDDLVNDLTEAFLKLRIK